MRARHLVLGMFLALGLALSGAFLVPPRDCRAAGICASTTCITDAQCGACYCARPGPGPQGFCASR